MALSVIADLFQSVAPYLLVLCVSALTSRCVGVRVAVPQKLCLFCQYRFCCSVSSFASHTCIKCQQHRGSKKLGAGQQEAAFF